MASYNSTPGRCLTKKHYIHGSIYLNLNKYNKYYIRTKINDASHNYNIPSEYNNNANLSLKDALHIIESSDIFIKNDTPQGWDDSLSESSRTTPRAPITAIQIDNNF
jgi:hypothetical protein